MTHSQTMSPTAALVSLSESDAPIHASTDIRGRPVFDRDANKIGKVDDLILDMSSGTGANVRLLRISSGGVLGIGAHHWLVPVDVIQDVTDDAIFLDCMKDQLTEAPAFAWPLDQEDMSRIYQHFGREPYWTPGYRYPEWMPHV